VDGNTLRDPQDAIYFIGQVNNETMSGLIDQIRSRTPESGTLDVVFTSLGGYNSAANAFHSWLSRFRRKGNIRVVASADVASAGLTTFLAFERRTADPAAQFRFHLVAPEMMSDDPAVAVLLKETERKLIEFIVERTNLEPAVVRTLMKERHSLSGETLFQAGICNEEL
jgi:ATP-dependent protease ClpP protease subunit